MNDRVNITLTVNGRDHAISSVTATFFPSTTVVPRSKRGLP